MTCLNLLWLFIQSYYESSSLHPSSLKVFIPSCHGFNDAHQSYCGLKFQARAKILDSALFLDQNEVSPKWRAENFAGIQMYTVCAFHSYSSTSRAFENITSPRLCIVTMVLYGHNSLSHIITFSDLSGVCGTSSLPICILSTTSISHCFSIEANIELWKSAADSAGSCTKETTTEDIGCGDLFLGKKLRIV